MFQESLPTGFNTSQPTSFFRHQPSIFKDLNEYQHTSEIAPSASLEESIQLRFAQSSDSIFPCDDEESAIGAQSRIRRNKLSRRHGNKHRASPFPEHGNVKRNICERCTYSCNRPEHLQRHIASKHDLAPKLYCCGFKGCKDKDNKRKVIKGRNDNFKAHYNKTHFSYGMAEKTGKNKRKSMKKSLQRGLTKEDYRWSMMLAGKMTMDEKIDDNLNVWKMIGFSIKETQELRVKDKFPEWQGPEHTTLDALEPRWKALRDGTLTYEQAMSRGADMKETPKQGLLGVTMEETRAMGIAQLDPRWKMWHSGKMSVEDSEMLGVKDLNDAPQARRKR